MDIALAIVIGGCALAGAAWGAVRMAAAILAVIAGILAGRLAGPAATTLLAGYGLTPGVARTAGVAITAVLAAGLVLLAARGLRRGIEELNLRWLDRVLGGGLAAAAALLVAALLLGLGAQAGHPPSSLWSRRLASWGAAMLGVYRAPASSTSPHSTPRTPTSSGQQP